MPDTNKNSIASLTREKMVLLAAALIMAVIVIAVLQANRSDTVQQEQGQQEPKFDLYSRTGTIKSINQDNSTMIVTIGMTEVVAGVAVPKYEDRTVKLSPETEYFSASQQALDKSSLSAGQEIVVYTTEDIDRQQSVNAAKIDVK